MAVYAVRTPGTSGSVLAIRAGVFEVRIYSVEMYSFSGTQYQIGMRRIINPTSFTGGTVQQVTPLRSGSIAASATAMMGTITTGGTSVLINQFSLATSTASVSGSSVSAYSSGATGTCPTPFSIAPGNVFTVGVGDSSIETNVFFEEIRLQCSF